VVGAASETGVSRLQHVAVLDATGSQSWDSSYFFFLQLRFCRVGVSGSFTVTVTLHLFSFDSY
jgi:hypothetical protein